MPQPKVNIANSSGDLVGVTGNALDVHLKTGTDSIDIGDVSLLLGGTAASTNAGTMDAQTLRVTLATDDTHWGTVGAGISDYDGATHAQLAYIGNKLASIYSETQAIDVGTSLIPTALSITGEEYAETDAGFLATGVRNDTLASLVSDNQDHAPYQVNDIGALYVTGEHKQNENVVDYNFTIMGETKSIDGSALPNVVGEGKNTRLAMSRSGIAYTCLTDDAGASDLGTTITTHLSEIEGAVETIEGAVNGSEMQVDVVNTVHSAITGGTNAIGKVGHDITGLASDDNPTVGTSAEAITTDGVDGAADCKRMDIMAHPSNTGEIWVGDAAVTTNGLNGGIRLLPGDVYSIDIDNTGDVYVVATVDEDNVSYNYFT